MANWYDSQIAQEQLLNQMAPPNANWYDSDIVKKQLAKQAMSGAKNRLTPEQYAAFMSEGLRQPTPTAQTPPMPPTNSGGGMGAGGGGGGVSGDPTAALSPQEALGAQPTGESWQDKLGPEGMAQLLRMGSIDQEQADAMARRDAEGPQGMRAGGMYLAANPLQHIVSGVDKYRGKKEVKALRKEEQEVNQRIIDLLTGNAPVEEEPASREMPDIGY